MKKILLLAGMAILMAACSKESALPDPVPPTGGGTTVLSFKVGLPAGDPITYAIQTEAEKQVKQLDIYQFGEGTTATLEAVFRNVTMTPTATGFSVNINAKGTGKKQFVFVANNLGDNVGGAPGIENLANGTISAGDFLKSVTKELGSNSLKSPLLMTAYVKDVDVQEAPAVNATPHVELVRIMSRLDIKNCEPYLTITRVRLERCLDRSYLVHQEGVATQKPAGSQEITLPEAVLPTAPTTPGSNPAIEMEHVAATASEGAYTHYKHVFYPYASDDVTQEAQAAVIVIEGTLFKDNPERATKVVYKKAIQVDGATNYLGFKRNTRYTLVIKKAIPGEIDAKLIVDKWNEDVVEATIEPMVPTPSHLIFSNVSGYSFDKATSTLIADNKAGATTLVVRANIDWEVLAEGASTPIPQTGQDAYKVNDWLQVGLETKSGWQDNNTQSVIPSGLRITCATNTGAERVQRLVLRCKADPNKQYLLTVKQRGV